MTFEKKGVSGMEHSGNKEAIFDCEDLKRG